MCTANSSCSIGANAVVDGVSPQNQETDAFLIKNNRKAILNLAAAILHRMNKEKGFDSLTMKKQLTQFYHFALYRTNCQQSRIQFLFVPQILKIHLHTPVQFFSPKNHAHSHFSCHQLLHSF